MGLDLHFTTGSLKKELPQACERVCGALGGEPQSLFGVLLSSGCHLPPIGGSNPPAAQMS